MYLARFKHASCDVMTIMVESKRALLTNLETFVHDPLVEWAKPKKVVIGYEIGPLYYHLLECDESAQ